MRKFLGCFFIFFGVVILVYSQYPTHYNYPILTFFAGCFFILVGTFGIQSEYEDD